MAPPKQRRKASLHSTGKVREADLLEHARALAEDPSLAIPICEGGCVLFSPVAAARRAIPKIHAARDDEAKLNAYARRGNDLARAYAATLLVAKSGKIPYVAELKISGASVPYVIRGKTKPFFLAGLQNHHDRALRLLALAPWVRKRGIHAWSADRGLVCTGRDPKPPADFVQEELDELGLQQRAPGRYDCGHADADALRLVWHTAGVTLERCEACAGDESTLARLFRHMAGPRIASGFRVEAGLQPLEGAAPDVTFALPPDAVQAYLTLAKGDAAMLEAARAARTQALRALGRRLYVAGTHSHGEDRAAFLADLNPTPAEGRALEAALDAEPGALILDKPTAARALAELWPRHGRAMLCAAAGHDATAESLYRERVTPEEAAELVRRAAREGTARAGLQGLPAYARLPPAAETADAIARAHRAGGAEAAVRVALERVSQGKAKGVALAFLQELNAAKGQDWRFTHVDTDVAATVASAAKALLSATPESYHEALAETSRRAGETATFAPR